MWDDLRSWRWIIIDSSGLNVDDVAPSICNVRVVLDNYMLAVVKHRHSAVRKKRVRRGIAALDHFYKNVRLVM